MARIRSIKPEFWEDEKIAKLSMPCRLFYIGTWNLADDAGVLRANPALLKSKIFPYDNIRVNEIEIFIGALVEARMLIPISHNGESYYVIRTFHSHQKFDARYPNNLIDKTVLDKLMSSQSAPPIATSETQCAPVGDTPREWDGMGEGREEGEGTGDGGSALPVPLENITPHIPDEREINFKKFEKWIIENALQVSKMKEPFTRAQFEALKRDFSLKQIQEMLKSMHNRADLVKKNVSANLTFRNWIKKPFNTPQNANSKGIGRKTTIPTETSGYKTTISAPTDSGGTK